MGVMACSREGCDGIMCSKHSHEHGYICYECFDELVETGPTTDIAEFMSSEKTHRRKYEALARYATAFEEV